MFSMPLDGKALHAAVHEVMNDAARRAIMPRYRRLTPLDMREKAVDELVTIADQESEAILTEGLSKILPQAVIVGEEAVEEDPLLLCKLGGSLCWIVDPLDGTANFVAGEGPFGIMVALAEFGTPIGGWILDPQSGRFVAALSGQGTLIDGERVIARASGAEVPIAGMSALLTQAPDRAGLVKKVRDHFTSVPIPRCAAEQYPAMIGGKSDITLFERTSPWDHAAGVLCLAEAGGKATRFDGSPYRVDDRQTGLIAAATPALWTRFREHYRGGEGTFIAAANKTGLAEDAH